MYQEWVKTIKEPTVTHYWSINDEHKIRVWFSYVVFPQEQEFTNVASIVRPDDVLTRDC